VLKELMDHVAVATTMGYYSVSLKRKQQARPEHQLLQIADPFEVPSLACDAVKIR
jgi:hypothetical protein